MSREEKISERSVRDDAYVLIRGGAKKKKKKKGRTTIL